MSQPAKSSKAVVQSAESYRQSKIDRIEQIGHNNVFPHEFHIDMDIYSLVKNYSNQLKDTKNQVLNDKSIKTAGRIYSIRSAGNKLFFIDVRNNYSKIQVMFKCTLENPTPDDVKKWKEPVANLNRGDIIGVSGFMGTSNTGELSLYAQNIKLLAPCLHMLPPTLEDPELQQRQRALHFIVNSEHVKTFQTRHKITKYIRNFFDTRGFMEVETPTLNPIPGGAAAKPFITHCNDIKQQMFMRIAPELYLKMLIMGGFEAVYEIGKQWRNESADSSHNPEFTSIEAYITYQDYHDMMNMTEDLLSRMTMMLFRSNDVVYNGETISFKPPFQRLRIIPELEKRLGVSFEGKDFNSDEFNVYLKDLCEKNSVECVAPHTTARLFDAMIAHYLEPLCTQPTFICDHPRIMSPLAKWHRDDNRLTERFELFVNKKELCNAYTELNDPIVQRQAFMDQMKSRASGDDESMVIDENYLKAMEHGLPPTAGWGLGIDRLVMFLTNSQTIQDVLTFPMVKNI